MNNDRFCIEGERVYTYTALMQDINAAGDYHPCSLYADLSSYFRNFILALAYGQPVTLLDADLSPEEIGALGLVRERNTPLARVRHWSSVEEVIAAVRQSASPIRMFTSGTTGQPKEVIHTPASFMRSVRIKDGAENHVWGYAYNPTHMAGLQVFFQAFCNRSTLVDLFRRPRTEVYGLIGRYGITHISATPTFYRLLLPFDGQSYGSVERITFGGEKSGEKLHQEIMRIFPSAKVNNIYASTEAGALFSSRGDTFHIPDDIRDRIRVEDGELLIHRSLLGQSSTFTFTDDYYRTGDLIEWADRAAGTFRFASRRNELINVGGYKINPNEVEEQIRRLPAVQNCIVYGKANSVLGNILCADVEPIPGAALTESDIRGELAGALQDFKIPRRIRFVDRLELTKTGKLKRK